VVWLDEGQGFGWEGGRPEFGFPSPKSEPELRATGSKWPIGAHLTGSGGG